MTTNAFAYNFHSILVLQHVVMNYELIGIFFFHAPAYSKCVWFECRAEYRSHGSIFYMNVFECRAECRSLSTIFKVCMVLNAELNVDLIARCSR